MLCIWVDKNGKDGRRNNLETDGGNVLAAIQQMSVYLSLHMSIQYELKFNKVNEKD